MLYMSLLYRLIIKRLFKYRCSNSLRKYPGSTLFLLVHVIFMHSHRGPQSWNHVKYLLHFLNMFWLLWKGRCLIVFNALQANTCTPRAGKMVLQMFFLWNYTNELKMNVEIHLFTVKLSLECKNETNIPFVPSDCPYIKVQVHKRLRVLFLSSQQAFNTKMYVTMQCLTEHTLFFFQQ